MAGRLIGCFRHFAAEGVYFLHQLAFCETADSGIARHQGNRIKIDIKKQCFTPHSRRGKSRFAPGMSRPDDDNIKFFWQTHNSPDLIT